MQEEKEDQHEFHEPEDENDLEELMKRRDQIDREIARRKKSGSLTPVRQLIPSERRKSKSMLILSKRWITCLTDPHWVSSVMRTWLLECHQGSCQRLTQIRVSYCQIPCLGNQKESCGGERCMMSILNTCGTDSKIKMRRWDHDLAVDETLTRSPYNEVLSQRPSWNRTLTRIFTPISSATNTLTSTTTP